MASVGEGAKAKSTKSNAGRIRTLIEEGKDRTGGKVAHDGQAELFSNRENRRHPMLAPCPARRCKSNQIADDCAMARFDLERLRLPGLHSAGCCSGCGRATR